MDYNVEKAPTYTTSYIEALRIVLEQAAEGLEETLEELDLAQRPSQKFLRETKFVV